MNKITKIAVVTFTASSLVAVMTYVAFAQQPAPGSPPVTSAHEQALGARIMSEINANLQCNTNIVELQERLAKDEAELKTLKEKPETKKESKKP